MHPGLSFTRCVLFLMFFLSLVLQWLISTVQRVELLNGCYLLYNFIPYPCLLNFRVKSLLSLRPCNQHAYPNTSPIRYPESALLPKVGQFLSYLISHLIIFYCRLSNHCTIPGIALPFYLDFLGFSDAHFLILILLSCKSIVSKRNWCLPVLWPFLVFDSSTCCFYQVVPVSSN